MKQFKEYIELLKKWNSSVSLVSKKTIDVFLKKYIEESCILFEYINNKNIHILDLGSGNGIPGIILSMLGAKKVTLVESKTKKCIFLSEAAKLSANKIEIINDRIENLKLSCDVITAKGFANIEKILYYASQIKYNDIYLIKGPRYKEEIINAEKVWKFDYRSFKISDLTYIISISNIKTL